MKNVEGLRVVAPKSHGLGDGSTILRSRGLLYAHHDVQPASHKKDLDEGPLEQRAGDADREGWAGSTAGSADDKGAITAQLVCNRVLPQDVGQVPVNVKMASRERRRSGSSNLMSLLQEYKEELDPTGSPPPQTHSVRATRRKARSA